MQNLTFKEWLHYNPNNVSDERISEIYALLGVEIKYKTQVEKLKRRDAELNKQDKNNNLVKLDIVVNIEQHKKNLLSSLNALDQLVLFNE